MYFHCYRLSFSVFQLQGFWVLCMWSIFLINDSKVWNMGLTICLEKVWFFWSIFIHLLLTLGESNGTLDQCAWSLSEILGSFPRQWRFNCHNATHTCHVLFPYLLGIIASQHLFASICCSYVFYLSGGERTTFFSLDTQDTAIRTIEKKIMTDYSYKP